MELHFPNWIFLLLILCISIIFFVKKQRNTSSASFLFLIKNKKRAHNAILALAELTNSKFLEIYIGLEKHVFVAHPDAMREVLKSEQIGQYQKVLTPLAARLGIGSIFNQNIGDNWRNQRTVISHPFQFENIKSYLPIFIRNTEKVMGKVEDNKEFEMYSWSMKLALENLGSAIFGEELDIISGTGSIAEFVHYYEKFQTYSTSPTWRMFASILERLPTKARNEYAKLIENMAELSKMLLEKKKDELINASAGVPNDVLSQMITQLPPAAAAANTFGLFLAGHETTARAIAWSFYFIGKYPDMQEKLYKEIYQITKGNLASHEDVKQMSYLDMFIKEVVRIRPSSGQFPARIALEDVTLCGHHIPKNTPMVLSIYTIHHLAEFWPNPEVFDPERFTPERSKDRHPYAYIPFSLGRRACLGANFAVLEIKVAVIMFLQKYKVTLLRESNMRPSLVGVMPDSVAVSFSTRQ